MVKTYYLMDEVLALDRPEVKAALNAFLDYVAEKGFDTSYTFCYDNIFASTIHSLRQSGTFNQDVADKLLHLYCVFVESLLPFQPSAETLRLAWLKVKEGNVLYFVPGYGVYSIMGCKEAAMICCSEKRSKPPLHRIILSCLLKG